MEPADLAGLFFNDSDEEAKGNALRYAQALSNQQQAGLLGMLSGDKVLGGVGQHLLASADAGQGTLKAASGQRLQKAIEAEKARTEQAFRQQQEAHMANQDAIQRAQLDARRYDEGGLGVIDHRTGKLVQYDRGGKPMTAAQQEKEWKDLTDAISTTRGRGNLNVQQQARLNSSDRLKALLLNPDGSLKQDLNPNTMSELAAASAGLVTGGSPAQHTIETMTPKTVGSDWAKVTQWLTNEPQGTNQRAFMQLMLDQAHREEETIKPQILKAQLQAVPNYAHLSKKDAVRYQSILRANGIDPSTLDDNGLQKAVEAVKEAGGAAPGAAAAPPRTLSPRDAAALKWASDPANANNPKAVKIRRDLGAP